VRRTVERVDVGGSELVVEIRGPEHALPVVLLHAFPLSRRMWDPQLDALQRDHRVLAPDLRGFGDSPDDGFPRTLERYVDDLLAMLDALERRPVVLVGLSMGGYVALRTMEREPDRVRALVLADTRSEPDDDAARLRRARSVEELRGRDGRAWAREVAAALVGPSTVGDHPERLAAVEAMIGANDPRGMAAALVAMAARTATTAALASVRVPTLVLVGAEDTLTPPDAAVALVRAVSGARLTVLPGAGHLSNLEAPEAFNRALLDFLRGLGSPQPPVER
jgi:pimeloyl-ACP methyl ester carboxylesterase